MTTESPRRANHRLAPAAAAFIAAFLVLLAVLEVFDLPRGARLALALLPVAAFAWMILEEVRLVRGLDELERRIQLEALAVAYPTAVLLVFAVGLLERAGFTVPAFEKLRDVWPLAVLPYLLGLGIARSRYG